MIPPRQGYWEVAVALSQRPFLIQESNRGLLHCRRILYQLGHREAPKVCTGWKIKRSQATYCKNIKRTEKVEEQRISKIDGVFVQEAVRTLFHLSCSVLRLKSGNDWPRGPDRRYSSGVHKERLSLKTGIWQSVHTWEESHFLSSLALRTWMAVLVPRRLAKNSVEIRPDSWNIGGIIAHRYAAAMAQQPTRPPVGFLVPCAQIRTNSKCPKMLK